MLLALLPVLAAAHEPGLSRVVVEADAIALSIAKVDAAEPAGLLTRAAASVDGEPCTIGLASLSETDNDGLEARAPLDCPAGARLELDAGWLEALPPGHRTLVEHEGRPIGFVDAGHRVLALERSMTAGAVALTYLVLGIEHILTGWDHLAFLAALLLVAGSLKEAAGVATGFTIAHSITLSLAALGVVAAPGWLVEPAIAATIVFVGLENLTSPPPLRRMLLTLALGLIHGLGFAGLLGELGLPPDHLVPALLAFNGGVELGQFAVVLVVLPFLLALRRDVRWRVHGVRWASLGVAAMGAFWLVTRVG